LYNTIHMRVSHSSWIWTILTFVGNAMAISFHIVVMQAGLAHIVMSVSQQLDVVSSLSSACLSVCLSVCLSISDLLTHSLSYSLTLSLTPTVYSSFAMPSDWTQMRMEDTALSQMSVSVTSAMQETCVKLVHKHCTLYIITLA